MKRLALLLLFIAFPAWAADLTIEGPDVVPPYKLVELHAGGPAVQGAAFDWDVLPEALADYRQRGDTLTLVGPPNQEYRVKCLAIRIIDGKPKIDRAVKVVRIGEAPPVPPGPGPAPPPTPSDPLLTTLQAAYAADVAAGRADKDKAKKLAAIYRQAAATTVPDMKLATTADLYKVVSTAAQSPTQVPLPGLQSVREAIMAELNTKIGRAVKPLDQATRDLCRDQFVRMSVLLEALR